MNDRIISVDGTVDVNEFCSYSNTSMFTTIHINDM